MASVMNASMSSDKVSLVNFSESTPNSCLGLRGSLSARDAAIVLISSSDLVSRSQTHYALANLLDGALAVKGLGTCAWPARARGMQLNERKNKIYRNYVTLNSMHEEPALVRLCRRN